MKGFVGRNFYELFWENLELFERVESILRELRAFWEKWELFERIESFLKEFRAFWENWELFE